MVALQKRHGSFRILFRHQGRQHTLPVGKISQAEAEATLGKVVRPISKDEAHDHPKQTLAGSKWEAMRGFHVLRHSFISALAAAGVDLRHSDHPRARSTDGTVAQTNLSNTLRTSGTLTRTSSSAPFSAAGPAPATG